MFCSNCGSEMEDNVNFCTNCGSKMRKLADESVKSSGGKRMGLFNKKTDEQKKAINEIKSYSKNRYEKFRAIVPRYGITSTGSSEYSYFNKIITAIKKEIENDGLTIDQIEGRVNDFLKEKYGDPMSEEEALQKLEEAKLLPKLEKEKKLEQKFGVQFHDKVWFKCTVEERRHSTFSNTYERDILDGYVFVEDNHLEIIKESIILKSKMGNRKIFFDNIASIDYDARGMLHASSNLEIYLKSSDKVQLKYVDNEMAKLVNDKFNEYMENKTGNVVSDNSNDGESSSNIDELMKYADLYERGLLTKEEFDQKKKELL